ncbi:proton-conducting transporter transmembrane domain-containing protein [Acidihalobacter prosperus]
MSAVFPNDWITGALLGMMPVGLILAALPPARDTRKSAVMYRNRVRWAAIFSLLAALTADMTFLLGFRGNLTLTQLSIGKLGFALPVSIDINGLTMALATLVSFVIAIIAQYSVQYLDGDPQQARFARLLAFTAGFFIMVVIAGNLGLFTLGIIATGFSLHRLLKFYGDRPKAIMAAHKKTIFSRTADLSLVVATILVGHSVGSLQFARIGAFAEHTNKLPISLQIAAWLIITAVILKSAQFPFHGWLIQVMEAPTPVSALMHAGVVYSGAIIALRTSQLLSKEPTALIFLSLIGLLTVVIASLVMTTQSAVKSMLAWSTNAQLGFMSLELGLGLFPLALLHLIGHSLYKAHAFLSSGSVTDQLRQVPPGVKKEATLSLWITSVILGLMITAGSAWVFGENPVHDPSWIALVMIIAVAVSQILIKGLQFPSITDRVLSVVIAAGMSLTYLLLHTLFVKGFPLNTVTYDKSDTVLYWGLVTLVAMCFLLLSWIQGPGRRQLSAKLQLALFTHLYNGLYVDYWVDQFSHRFWSEKVGIKSPRKNLAMESMQSIEKNQAELMSSGGPQ